MTDRPGWQARARDSVAGVLKLDTVDAWRQRVSELFSLGFAIGLPFILAPTFTTYVREGHYGLIAMDVAVWLYAVYRVLRPPAGVLSGAAHALSIIYFMMVIFFIELGPIHARPAWLVLTVTTAALMIGWRAALMAAAVNAALLIGLYVAMPPDHEAWADTLAMQASKYTMFVFNSTLLSLMCALPVAVLLRALARTLDEQRAAREEIQLLNRDLERRVASRTKDLESFTYSVSHDLRAPIRWITGYAEMALEDERASLSEDGIDKLEKIRTSAYRMSALLDALLDMSRLTSREPKPVRVDVSALAAEICAELQRERRAELVVADGLTAFADAALTRTILENLLRNAWKFTAGRQAHIEVGSDAEQDGLRWFFVRDNGVGFDMLFADKLFTPFQRLHSPDDFPGTGVGLATIKRIIDAHGGAIEAHGEEGQGATFRFSLPSGD